MKIKSKNKNMKKGNKLFMCFRPVGGLESEYGLDLAGGEPAPVLTYIAMSKKEHVVFPKATLPANDNETVSSEEKELEDFHGKKISRSRRFSHVLKAVLLEVSLARKIKRRKSDKKSKNLLSESARYNNHTSSKKGELEFDFGQRIISRNFSSSATSLSASTATNSNSACPTCSNSRSSVTKTTSFESSSTRSKKTRESVHQQYRLRGYYSCECGLFLMLMSLLFLVLWGKICAIFCTSTWFFFMPRGIVKDNHRIEPPPTLENSSEFKRKIVKEGLLARERGSLHCQ